MNREKYESLVEKVLKLNKVAIRSTIENYDDAQSRRFLGQFLSLAGKEKEALEVLESILEDFEEIEEENHVWILMLIAELYVRKKDHEGEATEYAIKAIDLAKNQRGEYMVLEKDEIMNQMKVVIDRTKMQMNKSR